MSNNVITVENLSKRYLVGHRKHQQTRTFREMLTREVKNFVRKAIDLAHCRQIIEGDEVEELWALQDVSFEVQEGDVLGIIGRNGAGKSTLLKILSRITEPTEGRITLRGRVSSLLEVGTGFHSELTGRENIYLNGAILGMRRSEINAQFDCIVAFAEVEKFLDMPVKWYSSGMYVRLAFAVAAHLNPEILFVDEVLAVGDANFQAKCLTKMGEAARSGRTILFVSHNTNAIERLCNRVVVLDKGGVAGIFDNPREGIGTYLGGGAMSAIWTNSGSEFRDNDYFTPQLVEAKSDSCAGAAFPQDHAIILTIDGIVHQSDPALQIGLFIYDDAERLVFMSWSTDSVEKNWPRLDRGPVRLSVTVPPRWLNEGIYRVELLAAIALRQWLIEPGNSAFIKFSIQGGLNASPYWTKREGVLAPVLEWQKST